VNGTTCVEDINEIAMNAEADRVAASGRSGADKIKALRSYAETDMSLVPALTARRNW